MIGQGVNQETLQISQVPHFSNGGSIHFVVNNQVGFTTPSARGKTSRNCTDLAKQIGAPVIRCNGDEPEVSEILKHIFPFLRKIRRCKNSPKNKRHYTWSSRITNLQQNLANGPNTYFKIKFKNHSSFLQSLIKATRLALSYQRRYRKDVFVDLVCYRRHGHNELDDPTFTNPSLYKVIHSTKTIPDMFADKMVEEGEL